MGLKVKDNGLKNLQEQMKLLSKYRIVVGILDTGEKNPNGESVLDIAIINHFGLRTPEQYIPPRPFITNYIDNYSADINKISAETRKLVLNGMPAMKAMAYMGEMLVKGIRDQITKDKPFIPNASTTIELKGSETPLVDSGILLSSISYKIIK